MTRTSPVLLAGLAELETHPPTVTKLDPGLVPLERSDAPTLFFHKLLPSSLRCILFFFFATLSTSNISEVIRIPRFRSSALVFPHPTPPPPSPSRGNRVGSRCWYFPFLFHQGVRVFQSPGPDPSSVSSRLRRRKSHVIADLPGAQERIDNVGIIPLRSDQTRTLSHAILSGLERWDGACTSQILIMDLCVPHLSCPR
jgi:hypothetical protein